jgi:beta-glucosidase
MKRTTSLFLLVFFLLASCGPNPASTGKGTPTLTPTATLPSPVYQDASLPVEQRVDDLLMRMTLNEKIGQMTQVELGSIQKGDVTNYYIGSILSGGDGNPEQNNPKGWQDMIKGFQDEALATRLRIPMIYGIDATHGNGHLYGGTILPQQIGMAATRDLPLVEQIGRVTAEEILATGVPWTFAPIIAVPQDIRWGRTYESFSEDTQLTTDLGVAYIKGLQTIPEGVKAAPGQTLFTLATPKHYLGDGGTIWKSSRTLDYSLDQRNMQVSEETLRKLYLPPYKAAVDSGAMNIMASFSSWRGTKMHANRYLLTDVLKIELGFKGFVVSDWGGMDQVDENYYTAIVDSVNAGVDMNMVPYDYLNFIGVMQQAVDKKDISIDRIDDAVRRILRTKFEMGLFDNPYPDPTYMQTVRSDEHIAIARQAVRESMVLLRNDNAALPISKTTPTILVAGPGADDIGMMCGGWTLTWQGSTGNITTGTTIINAVRRAVSPSTNVEYSKFGDFKGHADVGIVVVGETPYAEGNGDKADLSLSDADVQLIEAVRPNVDKLVVLIISGRPMVITEELATADAWVAAWLPGTEGEGITDGLFGDYTFTGKLPFTWPRNNDQLPINKNNDQGLTGCDAPLFPFGYGLGGAGSTPIVQPDCSDQ